MNKLQVDRIIEKIEERSFRVYCGAFSKVVIELEEVELILGGFKDE